MLLVIALSMAACTVTDGDTIRCGSERIRLLGIDAPDDPGNSRCRPFPKPGAVCDRRRAIASKAALQRAMVGLITIDRVKVDVYGRTIGHVFADYKSLSCRQIEAGQARYVARWDDGGRVTSRCPQATRQ